MPHTDPSLWPQSPASHGRAAWVSTLPCLVPLDLLELGGWVGCGRALPSAHPCWQLWVGETGLVPDPGPLLGLFPKNCPWGSWSPTPARDPALPSSFFSFPHVFPSFLPAVLD